MAFAADIPDSLPTDKGTDTPPLTPELESALSLLTTGDFQARWDAAKRVTAAGNAAIAPLVHLIKDEDLDWEARWFAARTLGSLEDSDALAALVEVLQQAREPELVSTVAQGLSRFGAAAVAALTQLFDQPAHRKTAIQALASIRHRSVLTPLISGAEDEDSEIRAIAISALGNFQTPAVDSLLMAAVTDPAAPVRREAVNHLGLRTALLQTADLVAVLEPCLLDLKPSVSKATAGALGRLGSDAAVASLSRALQSIHTPEDLRISLVRALGWTGRDSALLALLAARQVVSPAVQVEIIEALARFEISPLRQRAGESLSQWLKDEAFHTEAIVQAIALALAQLDYRPSIPLLQRLATQAEDQTRLYAQAALRQLTARLEPDGSPPPIP